MKTRSVLLVEDEQLVRTFLAQLLRKHRWTVTEAASPEEALVALAASAFQLILCDLDLKAEQDGLDVLKQLPPINRHTPFVILTAHGSIGRCREAFLNGSADFLEKPVVPAALIAALDRAAQGEPPVLSAEVLRELGDDDQDDPVGARHIRHALAIIERRYRDADFTIAELGKSVGVSPEHLSRLFTTRVGRAPLDYLHEVRIRASESMLADEEVSIFQVAAEHGYRSTSDYDLRFRKLRGCTPTEWRLRKKP